MTWRLIALSVLLAYPAAPLVATEHDIGGWLVFSSSAPLGDDQAPSRWRYWLDTQARFFDVGSGAAQYLVRPAIGYDLSDSVTAWAGYARFRTRGSSGNYADEDRFWQQLTWKAGRWLDGTMTYRIRLEQRSVSVSDEVGLELRLMARYVRQLAQHDLIVALESFLSLRATDWSGDAKFSQNRLFVGAGRNFDNGWRVEAGYLNQFVARDAAANRINHLIVVNGRFNF